MALVAPHVGAWIETFGNVDDETKLMSHPMWVRGLKLTRMFAKCLKLIKSHPMWVRGLKHQSTPYLLVDESSHPMWVRGLKQETKTKETWSNKCRTPCGCVD